MLFDRITHDPEECRTAIGATDGPVYIDIETTGVHWCDSIVSVGVLVDGVAFILFVDSHNIDVIRRQITMSQLRHALEPLGQRPELIAVLHNAIFDLGKFSQNNIPIVCKIHDTRKLLKLWDSDRGGEKDSATRWDRRFRKKTNYKLKSLLLHECRIKTPDFPGGAASLSYNDHTDYLTCDLLSTKRLYQHIKRTSPRGDFRYYDSMVAPLTPILVEMRDHGVRPDPVFLDTESERLLKLMRDMSGLHDQLFGQRLDAGDFDLRGWVYFYPHGLKRFVGKCYWVKVGGKKVPPLDGKTLLRLRHKSNDPRVKESLELMHDYRKTQGLMRRLKSLTKHIKHDGLIHATSDDWQASGRVSVSHPNLQGVAGKVGPRAKSSLKHPMSEKETVYSRNVIISRPDHWLVAFDIAQADVRVLAHATESFPVSSIRHLTDAWRRKEKRAARSSFVAGTLLKLMWFYFREENKNQLTCPYVHNINGFKTPCKHKFDDPRESGEYLSKPVTCPKCGHLFTMDPKLPDFHPKRGSGMANDFRKGTEDFYTTATRRMLGLKPTDKVSKKDRNHMKQTILGIVNGMSKQGLAARLTELFEEKVTTEQAGEYLDKFAEAYPQESSYIEMMYYHVGFYGWTRTFAGRRRRLTNQWWMSRIDGREIEIRVSYRRSDKLWLRVIPLRSGRRTLTCWVRSVIDCDYHSDNKGTEIYNDIEGRISTKPYRFFKDDDKIFELPVRNVSWRIIREVRTKKERQGYNGFDKARRQLVNNIFQGGTADVARLMMMRSQPMCEETGAKLLLQIHDELLFEVPWPSEWWKFMDWIRCMKAILERPPTPDFKVPIVVEPKIGKKFGELHELQPWELEAWRHPL